MQRVQEFKETAVVARAERGERDLVVTGRLAQAFRLPVDRLHALFTERAVQKARLTEAAAADAAAQHLHDRAVVDDVEERHDEGFGEIHVVHVVHNALLHRCGRAVLRDIALHGAVVIVLDVVERRHVDAFDLRGLFQKFVFRLVFGAAAAEQLDYLEVHLLAVAEEKDVDKVGQRLRVARARPARDDDIFQRRAVAAQKRHARELQHVQNIRVAQLVLQREADEVELAHRVAAFEAVERDAVFQHSLLHVDPRRKDALAPDVIDAVHQRIKDLDTEVRHADLVRIRKAERKAHVHLLFIFHDRIELAADVAPRLLHLRQDPVQFRAQFHRISPIVFP